mmetsp:Transcript_30327/g.55391  ORF Transcript_30327/g.55391 Transcript_30327/m.55391 type:complete len:263 (+) Transcript_30327:1-789(+)
MGLMTKCIAAVFMFNLLWIGSCFVRLQPTMAASVPEAVVVTGANGGIGTEFCRHYASLGSKVFAACRKATDEVEALKDPNIEILGDIDVTSQDSVNRLAAVVKNSGKQVDLLINNAGVIRNEHLFDMNVDSIQKQFDVNGLGAIRVTSTFLKENVIKMPGAKIALITSQMGSMDDNGSGGYYGYRMSKAALNAAGVSMALDLRQYGVHVAILHPGWVSTKMTGYSGLINTAESVRGMVEKIDGLNEENTGTWWHTNGKIIKW